eukprot:1340330-Amphidinium_carterae.1
MRASRQQSLHAGTEEDCSNKEYFSRPFSHLEMYPPSLRSMSCSDDSRWVMAQRDIVALFKGPCQDRQEDAGRLVYSSSETHTAVATW